MSHFWPFIFSVSISLLTQNNDHEYLTKADSCQRYESQLYMSIYGGEEPDVHCMLMLVYDANTNECKSR